MMPITVTANPTALTWIHFLTAPARIIDPNDGTLVDAYTTFNYNMPDLPPRIVSGQLALADPLVITITPNARVWSGVAQTPALLSHEQLHYDVGIVTGRALARELMRMRAASVPALRTALQDAVRLHFETRARLIQRRYDLDTRHGTNAHYQSFWKSRMAACLADARSDHLAGFWL